MVNPISSSTGKDQVRARELPQKSDPRLGRELGIQTQSNGLATTVANPAPTSASISDIIREATDGDSSEALRLSGSGSLRSRPAGTAHDEATDGDSSEVETVARSGRVNKVQSESDKSPAKKVETSSDILKEDSEFKSDSGFDYQAHINKLRSQSGKEGKKTEAETAGKAGSAEKSTATEAAKAVDPGQADAKTSTAPLRATAKKRPTSIKPAEIGTEMALEKAEQLRTILNKDLFKPNRSYQYSLLRRQEVRA